LSTTSHSGQTNVYIGMLLALRLTSAVRTFSPKLQIQVPVKKKLSSWHQASIGAGYNGLRDRHLSDHQMPKTSPRQSPCPFLLHYGLSLAGLLPEFSRSRR
jgi:hypothetical protein